MGPVALYWVDADRTEHECYLYYSDAIYCSLDPALISAGHLLVGRTFTLVPKPYADGT